MGVFCSSCGKKFDSDTQKFCPHCGAPRPAGQPQPAEPKRTAPFIQNDTKTVSAERLRSDFEASRPAPKKKAKRSFFVKLVGAALVLYGLTTLCPQTKVPFARLYHGEPFATVATDTFYDLTGLVGFGDKAAVNLVKDAPVQDSALKLGEALARTCSASSWRATKRDGKPAAVFSGTLKNSAGTVSVTYIVEGDHCSLAGFTQNGREQTAQALDELIAAAAK